MEEAVALPNQEAKTVSRAFFEYWIVRFVCPVNQHNYPESNFLSKYFLVFAVNYEFRGQKKRPAIHKGTRQLKEQIGQ